jgi:hypothetical protein
VNAALIVIGFFYRVNLRPEIVRAEEIVRDAQPSGRVAF